MATTINRSGVTLSNDTGTPGTPNLDGTLLDNAWVQTFMDRIDALLTGATFDVSGRLVAAGFGAHTLDASGTGGQTLSVRNTTAGTGNFGQVQIGNDASATALLARMTSSSFTASGVYRQNAGHVICDRPGGLVLAATDAAGKLRLVAGGANGGSVAIGTSDTGRNAWIECVSVDGNGGNNLFWGHPNQEYTASLAGMSGAGVPVIAAYAYHSTTANTFARASGTNVPCFLLAQPDGSWEFSIGTAGTAGTDTGRTDTLKIASTGQVRVKDSVSGAPGLAGLAATQAGLAWASNTQLDVYVSNLQRFSFYDTISTFGPSLTVQNGAFGAGAVSGGGVVVGRNSSGSGAAGYVGLQQAGGSYYYLWIDATGDLRVHTAPPTASGSVSDTAGTVVGTQT